jgi:hypothetical protein
MLMLHNSTWTQQMLSISDLTGYIYSNLTGYKVSHVGRYVINSSYLLQEQVVFMQLSSI